MSQMFEVGQEIEIRVRPSVEPATVTVVNIQMLIDGDTLRAITHIRDAEGNVSTVGAFTLAKWMANANN